jgi:glycosyltransferase involved in cell wall biosynthesis
VRIAVDATPLIGPGTGVATFTRGAITSLAARPDVDLVAYGLTFRGRRALGTVVPAGVSVVGRPMPAAALLRSWRRIEAPPVEWWTGAVDVVHGTNFVVPPSRRAARIVTVYDLTAVRYPELCAPASLRYPDLVRRAVARGAWVHTLASSIAEEVVALHAVPADRVRVVPSGLDPAPAGDAAAGRRVAGADRYVLALGTIEPRKGFPALVAAFDDVAALDDGLVLVIAGPDGWGAAGLDDAISTSLHAGRIRRLGWVDAGVRADLLAGAAVLAAPSVYEGFGYPPLEAMAVGTPVVATAVGSLPEVLGDAAMLVPAGDRVALAGALAAVVHDVDGLATNLRRRGPARAASFGWDACAAGLLELYRDALAGQG